MVLSGQEKTNNRHYLKPFSICKITKKISKKIKNLI
jgi:hypothetical protein